MTESTASEASTPPAPDLSGRAPLAPLTLRFRTPELERSFLAEYRGTSRRQVRGAILLVVVLYFLFGFLDRAIIPEVAGRMAWMRILVCIVLVAVLALTWTRFYDRWREWLLGLSLTLATGAIVWFVAVGGSPVEQIYYVGLILAILGVHTLFRLRWPLAVTITVAVIAAYEILLAATGASRTLILTNNFFLISATLLVSFASYHLERLARKTFWQGLQVEEERRRSDRLLLNILPAPIAERLKREPGPIAERFDDASVLFADIVGFTALSSTMEPDDLVRLLNRVFTEFDHIMAEHGLEKIKTIGDAYMVAAGLPMRAPDHVERIVEAALAMHRRAAAMSADLPARLDLRIGIAAGPVVAGVIGESKFIYDLWGDAVTTASRMESHGLAGKIQVTESVYQRIKHRYPFSRREDVEIKGKGKMATYLLEVQPTVPPAT